MRNVSRKVMEKIKTHILYSTTLFSFFFSEKLAFYEIMWECMKETDGPQVTIKYDASALRAG